MTRLIPAEKADIPAVLSLYHDAIGSEFSTWNEYYPSAEEADADLEAGCLYVLRDGGRVVGAISIIPERELDGHDFWTVRDAHVCEIARVVVAKSEQDKGYAKFMVASLLELLRSRGCTAVHLSVAVKNIPAQSLYRSAGFVFSTEIFSMYGNEYYLCEKVF